MTIRENVSMAVLDRMSNGRVLLGIGVGWMPDEFEIVGEDFTNRGKRTDEMITLMRAPHLPCRAEDR